MKKIFLDGNIVEADQRFIDALTPGILRAKGGFETMRFQNGNIVALDAHLKRLFKGLKLQKIISPYSARQLREHVLSLPKTNSLTQARLRLMVWQDSKKTHAAIICEPLSRLSQKGCRAIISKITRPQTKLSQLKTLDYSPFRKAFVEAKRRGFDEAILLNKKGEIVEGSRTNIFFVKRGILHTPALSCGCLAGVTRQMILRIARKNKIPCRMVKVSPGVFMTSDEAFLTNSVAGIVPLIKVNHRRIGVGKLGPLTQFFSKAYQKLVSLFLGDKEGTAAVPAKRAGTRLIYY